MGFFSRHFKKLSHKLKKVGQWHDIANKAKKGWNIGTQILGKAREILPKVKRVVEVAALIPGVGEFAAPVAAGLETADAVLTQIEGHKAQAERVYKQGKSAYQKVGKYADRLDKVKNFNDAVGVGRDVYKDARTQYGRYKARGVMGVADPSARVNNQIAIEPRY